MTIDTDERSIPSSSRTGRLGGVVAVVVLVVASVLGGLMVEQVRANQGHPELSFINDPYYYRAMSSSLWTQGSDLAEEARRFAPTVPPDKVTWLYNAPGWRDFLHAENGLSHQPPYAYRILVPTLVGWMAQAGISVPNGYLLFYLAGLVLVALALYRLSVGRWRWSFWGLTIALSTAAVLSMVTHANYVDGLCLGLATVAFVAARGGHLWLFVTVATLASLARETGLLLGFVWILYCLARGEGWRRWIAGGAPIVAAAVPHIIVHVPNPSIDYAELTSQLATPTRIATRLCVIGILVLAAAPARHYPDFRRAWPVWAIPVVGALAAVAMTMTSFSEARTALLMLPLLIAAGRWPGDVTWTDAVSWSTALGSFLVISYVRWSATPFLLFVLAASLLALMIGVRLAIRRWGPTTVAAPALS